MSFLFDTDNRIPPVLTHAHINEIITILDTKQLDFNDIELIKQQLDDSESSEIDFEMIPPRLSKDEFMSQIQTVTLSEFLDLIDVNYDRIAEWGGLPTILDTLEIKFLSNMILTENSVSSLQMLLQIAYRHYWANLNALLDDIEPSKLFELVQAEDYEDLSSLLSDLRRYQWNNVLQFEYRIFQHALQESEGISYRLLDALIESNASKWIPYWISNAEVLVALRRNSNLSIFGLHYFLKTHAPPLYIQVMNEILRDGGITYPLPVLL